MPNFKYAAKDRDGKTVNGSMEAVDRSAAIDILRKRDLIIITVNEATPGFKMPSLFGGKKKVKLEDLVVFSRQLATMVDAGIPLVGALDILGEQMDNRTLGEITINIRNDVETGSSLSDAMAKHKKAFSSLFVNMVKAGESSGMLDDILDRVAEYMEKTNSLQKKVKSALVYPAIVSCMALAITLVLLLKVIPVFKTIFEGFGAQLPTPTLVLINISDALQHYFVFVAAAFIIIGFLLSRYINTDKGPSPLRGYIILINLRRELLQ